VVQKVLASKKKNLKARSNVQLKQKTVAKGDPNHRKMVKAMKPLKNKINDVQAKVEAQIAAQKAKQGDMGLKKPSNPSNLETSSRKNFNHIFNSMNPGTNIVHHEDLHTEMAHKIGSDGKTLGKMQTKNSVRDGKTAMGNANAVQAEEDVNTGSV